MDETIKKRVILKETIEIQCQPFDQTTKDVCDYSWKAKFLDPKTIEFELTFENPLLVSQEGKDK